MSSRKIIAAAVVSALILIVSQGALYYHGMLQRESLTALLRAHDSVREIEGVNDGLATAEAALHKFVRTRPESALLSFEEGIQRTRRGLAKALRLTTGSSAQQQQLRTLERLAWQRVAQLYESLAEQKREGASYETMNTYDVQLTGEIRERVAALLQAEELLLSERTARSEARASQVRTAGIIAAGFSLIVFALVFWGLEVQGRRRATAEQKLQQKLELVRHLQACRNVEEAYAVTSEALSRALSDTSGAIYDVSPGDDRVVATAKWGPKGSTHRDQFRVEECWALRMGQTHIVGANGGTIPCPHCAPARADSVVCRPLVVSGEVTGLLSVSAPPHKTTEVADIVRLVSAGVALAISNLKVQEKLQQLSTRDGLTGLFNRRYFDETLERELTRALRSGLPLSLVLIDIDHFKRINDEFGHAAGDLVLRELGQLLTRFTRASDVVARFGGEEFAVLLMDMEASDAFERVAQLHAALATLTLSQDGRQLGPLTFSAGLAESKEGTIGEELVRTADRALYEAKRSGRDRTIAA